MIRLLGRPRLLVALGLGALAAIVVLGPEYGNLQTAADADAFRALLPDDDRLRYLGAVVADFAFAALYGAAALAIAPRFVICRIGAWLVVAGAAFDEIENVFVLLGVLDEGGLTDRRVDWMRTVGEWKNGCIAVGLLLVLLGLLASALWNHHHSIAVWVRLSRWRYIAFLALVLLVIPAAYLRNEWLVGILLGVIAAASVWLNRLVREDRACANSHGLERTLLSVVQLVIGIAFLVVGAAFANRWLDWLFFLGLVLAVMSLGALVSEARQTTWLQDVRGPVLVAGALTALVAATSSDGWTAVGLGAAGLVVGEFGVELASRDYQEAAAPPSPWIVAGGGALLLLTGLSLFISAGADPVHTFPLVGILAVVVLFASADGDALAIVVVIAFALAWALSPAGESPDDAIIAEEHRGEPYFVVFGDSYISGEGAEQFIPETNRKVADPGPNDDRTHGCRQAPSAWPFLVADRAAESKDETVPQRVLFLGCSGAVTENIHTEPRQDEQGDLHGPALLDLYGQKVTKIGRPPEFAVISIGGNDGGFGDIVQTCIAPGNCAEVGSQFLRGPTRRQPDQPLDGSPGKGEPESLVFINDDLDSAYQRMRDTLGDDVPIIAIPYPDPVSAGGRCTGALLGRDERRFVSGFAHELNRVIRAAANRNGLLYMAPMQDSLRREGAQLCNAVAGQAGLNFLALNPTAGTLVEAISPANWTHNSMHPNADGHLAMAAVAWEWLHDEANLPPEALPRQPDASYEVQGITAVLDGIAVPQCDPDDRASCSVDNHIWVIERLHELLAAVLFPVVVVLAGLWLTMAPLVRWRYRRFQDGDNWPLGDGVLLPVWKWLTE